MGNNQETDRLIPPSLGLPPHEVYGYEDDDYYDDKICGCVCLGRVCRKLKVLWNGMIGVLVKGWQMARNDPRTAVFSAKMGLALALISLLIFWKEPLPDISEHYVWAILTVVVVFEFSIGNCCFTYSW